MTQGYKTVYFADYAKDAATRSGLTISFGQTDRRLFQAVSGLSSYAIRRAIHHDNFAEVQMAAEKANVPTASYVRDRLRASLAISKSDDDGFDVGLQSTFAGGRGSPLHGWFPYLEGYSPDFVREIIKTHVPAASSILDPFCGSGTTALTSARLGLRAGYCEVNPVCRSIIKTKILALTIDGERREELARSLDQLSNELEDRIKSCAGDDRLRNAFADAFGKRPFFDRPTFDAILSLRTLIDQIATRDEAQASLAEVAVLGCLVNNSLLIRRGDLRFRNESELENYRPALVSDIRDHLRMIASDLHDLDQAKGSATLACADLRDLDPSKHGTFDAVITSPPYLNGTNYFRNTKIELWFTRSITTKTDLRVFRDAAITSGINDVTTGKTRSRPLPDNRQLDAVLKRLRASAYDQRIPKMVASYFAEMDEAFENLRSVLTPGATVAIDLGDSCYGGVHVPTDVILRECMGEKGYEFISEHVLRERQSRTGHPLRQTLQIFKVK